MSPVEEMRAAVASMEAQARSHVNTRERRVYAKKLRVGDRVLASMEDAKVAAFTVHSLSFSARLTGYPLVEVVGTDGTFRALWPTDALIVEDAS